MNALQQRQRAAPSALDSALDKASWRYRAGPPSVRIPVAVLKALQTARFGAEWAAPLVEWVLCPRLAGEVHARGNASLGLFRPRGHCFRYPALRLLHGKQ